MNLKIDSILYVSSSVRKRNTLNNFTVVDIIEISMLFTSQFTIQNLKYSKTNSDFRLTKNHSIVTEESNSSCRVASRNLHLWALCPIT